MLMPKCHKDDAITKRKFKDYYAFKTLNNEVSIPISIHQYLQLLLYRETINGDDFKKGIVAYFCIDPILVYVFLYAWFCALHSLYSINDINEHLHLYNAAKEKKLNW